MMPSIWRRIVPSFAITIGMSEELNEEFLGNEDNTECTLMTTSTMMMTIVERSRT